MEIHVHLSAEARRRCWPIVMGGLSLAAAIGSAGAAWLSYQSSRHAILDARLAQYVDVYEKFLSDDGDQLAHVDAFREARPAQKSEAILTAGLLVGVVEAMSDIGDTRAPQWACFLHSVQGPLLAGGTGVDDYASEKAGRDAIASARRDELQYRGNAGVCRGGEWTPK